VEPLRFRGHVLRTIITCEPDSRIFRHDLCVSPKTAV
jgi:hypothetical protein